MDREVEIVEDYNPLVDEEKQKEERKKRLNKKRRVIFLRSFLIVLAMVLVFLGYLSLDVSKVKDITVSGNDYLSKDYIIKIADIDYSSRYVFVLPSYLSAKLKENELIEDAEVVSDLDCSVSIKVKLKKAVGYEWENNNLYIVLANGNKVYVTNELYSSLTTIPFWKDFTDDQQTALINGLSLLDDDVIGGIAEIWPYVASYDPDMYRFLMIDGNQVISSADGIKLLANYYGIAEQVGTEKSCILLYPETNNAAKISCEEVDTLEDMVLHPENYTEEALAEKEQQETEDESALEDNEEENEDNAED